MVVCPFLKTFAISKFSVDPTQNQAFKILSQDSSFHSKEIFSSSTIFLYPIASSPFKCASIGLFQILHPPGKGIVILPKK